MLSAHKAIEIEDQSKLRFKTLALQNRVQAKLLLPNGMRVLLISDSQVKRSSASLTLNRGSLNDPENFSGLAHLTEHMLFSGTEKFPNSSQFMSFVSEHHGQYNGMTSRKLTSFVFDIDSQYFQEAITQFSEFFISPLFNPQCLSDEIKVVNQEAVQSKQEEATVITEDFIFQRLAKLGHPITNDVGGNEETLKDVTTQIIREWYQQNYSADLMTLVVISTFDMNCLKPLIIDLFSPIKKVAVSNNSKIGFCLDTQYQGTILHVEKPEELNNTLSLMWELETQPNSFLEKPITLLSVYLETTSQGLLAELEREELVHSLETRKSAVFDSHFFYFIDINLTNKGLSQFESILKKVFEAIANIGEEGFPEFLFEEMMIIKSLEYTYHARQASYNEAETLSKALACTTEGFATFPQQTLFPSYFNPEAVRNLARQLKPNSCFYILSSEGFDTTQAFEKDDYTQRRYRFRPTPQTVMTKLMGLRPNPSIQLKPNIYSPPSDDLQIVHTFRKTSIEDTQTVIDDASALIYFVPDTEFQSGKIAIFLNIYSSFMVAAQNEPRLTAFASLYNFALTLKLNSFLTMGSEAGFDVTIEMAHPSLKIRFSGFYSHNTGHNLLNFINDLFQKILKFTLTEEEFDYFKNQLLQRSKNVQLSPLEQALKWRSKLVFSEYISTKKRLKQLINLTYSDFVKYQADLFSDFFIKGILGGNLELEMARSLHEEIRKFFTGRANSNLRSCEKTTQLVRPATKPIAISKTVKGEQSSGHAILVKIDGEPQSSQQEFFIELALAQILELLIQQRFHLVMREKVAAYDANTDFFVLGEPKKISFQFYLQTKLQTPEILLGIIEAFIAEFLITCDDENSRRFNETKQAIINQKKMPPQQFSQVITKVAYNLFMNFGVQSEQTQIEALEKLTYDDFKKYTKKFLSLKENPKRLAILCAEPNEQDEEKLPTQQVNSYEIYETTKILRHGWFFKRDTQEQAPIDSRKPKIQRAVPTAACK